MVIAGFYRYTVWIYVTKFLLFLNFRNAKNSVFARLSIYFLTSTGLISPTMLFKQFRMLGWVYCQWRSKLTLL